MHFLISQPILGFERIYLGILLLPCGGRDSKAKKYKMICTRAKLYNPRFVKVAKVHRRTPGKKNASEAGHSLRRRRIRVSAQSLGETLTHQTK